MLLEESFEFERVDFVVVSFYFSSFIGCLLWFYLLLTGSFEIWESHLVLYIRHYQWGICIWRLSAIRCVLSFRYSFIGRAFHVIFYSLYWLQKWKISSIFHIAYILLPFPDVAWPRVCWMFFLAFRTSYFIVALFYRVVWISLVTFSICWANAADIPMMPSFNTGNHLFFD